MISFILHLLLIITICTVPNYSELISTGPPLEVVKQWNLITYHLPWDFPDTKEFNDPENIIATGLALTHDRIFIATPRLFSGVPATVSVVPRKDMGDLPILQAYPDWTYHSAGRKEYNCSDIGLVSVYRMKIDSCNRLWALDAGVSRSLEDYEITCPPKILVIDLNTDQVVRRIDFPREVIRGETLFTNLIIDETTASPENHCDDVFVYISDTVEPAIVVYDSGRDLTWRLSHPSMYPDPNFAQSTILGHKFTLMDGIVGLAFDSKAGVVYFQPLATDRLFSVTTAALRAGPLQFGAELPVRLVGKKSSQGIGLAVSPQDGSIIFSPVSETAVAQWNPKTNDQKVLSYDQDQLQFVADMSIPSLETNSIFILSSKFHRFFLKNIDPREINTRILRLENVQNSFHDDNLYGNNINYVVRNPLYNNNNLKNTYVPYSPTIGPKRPTTSYVENYFNSIRQPYQYEPVGVVNRGNINPFTSLNTGERPESFRPTSSKFNYNPTSQYGIVRSNQYYKTGLNFNDLNGLRVAKSILYNSTVNH